MGCRGRDNDQGQIQRGVHPARAPPKIGKNMIFLCKITIFHTKYPQKILRLPLLGAIFLSMPSPNWKSWIRPWWSYGS
jgi:hypothetical protein